MTEVIADSKQMQKWSEAANGVTGFVATMGALHAGHMSLIERARSECDNVVVSIFVNPTQFGPNEDLAKYPRPFEDDLQLCENVGVDVVFHPTEQDIYPNGEVKTVSAGKLGTVLEGASRPGHFDGVATVVTRLLAIVKPQRTYWGKKDAQQCAVIRQTVRNMGIDIETIFCDVVRDRDGVALSSRNRYLTDAERKAAQNIPKALSESASAFLKGTNSSDDLITRAQKRLTSDPLLEVDYIAIVNPETFESTVSAEPGSQLVLAVRIGTTRLIDMLEFG
jgi:pantoate--beta-alanine ligase